MITTGSGICLVISVLVTIFIVLKRHGHVDSYDGASAVLLPFLILAYWLKAQVSAPESALLIIAFIEMATCLLLAVTMFSMLRSIGIMPRLWAKAVVYGAVAALLFPLSGNSNFLSVWISVQVSLSSRIRPRRRIH